MATGPGWRSSSGSSIMLGIGALCGAAIFIGPALYLALAAGRWWALLLGVPGLGFLLAITALSNRQPNPPRLVETERGRGLLLPVNGLSTSGLLGVGLLGLTFWLGAAVLVVQLVTEHAWVNIIGVLLLGAIGWAFLGAVRQRLRVRKAETRGVVLTPEALVIRLAAEVSTLPWDEVLAVERRWQRSGRFRLIRPIRNQVVVRTRSGVTSRPIDIAMLGMDAAQFAATLQWYLAQAGTRAELTTDAALRRVAQLPQHGPNGEQGRPR